MHDFRRMENRPASRLDIAARKVRIKSLHGAKRVSNDTPIPDLTTWKINDKHMYSIIWIQGRVIKVYEGGHGFLLDDDTSVAEVDCSNVPAGCPKPHLECYMMVIGELLDVQPSPTVRAMKIQDLSNYNQSEVIWPLEVQDSDMFFASQNK